MGGVDRAVYLTVGYRGRVRDSWLVAVRVGNAPNKQPDSATVREYRVTGQEVEPVEPGARLVPDSARKGGRMLDKVRLLFCKYA